MSVAPQTAQQRFMAIALRVFVTAACLFLVVPIIAIIPISFSSGSFLSYPMPGFSLQWYEKVLQPFPWLETLKNSTIIAIFATVIATTLGTLAAYGLTISRFPGRGVVLAVMISPLIVPIVVVALGVYFLFARIGLIGTFAGLILAHAALGVPFVVITVLAALQGFDRRLVRASASLGASPLSTFFNVTFPLIAPGILSGALFAFMTSFDEVIIALFIASPAQLTLPRQLFSGLRDQLDPSIVAMSTILVAITALLVVCVELLRRRAAGLLAATEGRDDG